VLRFSDKVSVMGPKLLLLIKLYHDPDQFVVMIVGAVTAPPPPRTGIAADLVNEEKGCGIRGVVAPLNGLTGGKAGGNKDHRLPKGGSVDHA
jgi:hypothetical protein